MILAKECPSYPHVPGWNISGGSGIPDDELRRQIRARLSEARLPAVDGVGIVLIAHEPCYTLWREESVLFLTPRRP